MASTLLALNNGWDIKMYVPYANLLENVLHAPRPHLFKVCKVCLMKLNFSEKYMVWIGDYSIYVLFLHVHQPSLV